MKYIVCEKPGAFKMKEKDVPCYSHDEVLLKIISVGICGTDLHAFQGNQAFFQYPRILGHELAAHVVEVGESVQDLATGDQVAILPYIHCGECVACKQGKTNCCSKLDVLGVHSDGGMQEYFAIDPALVIRVNGLLYKELAIVEPLAIGAHAIGRGKVREGDTVVVVGSGPIGLGLMFFAKSMGATVIAVDRVLTRLQFAKRHLGVDHIVDANSNPVRTVRELTGGDLANIVFDATGHKGAMEMGHQYMGHGGKYVLVGLNKGTLSFDHPSLHAKEASLLCSRNATIDDFKTVISALASGLFPTHHYVTHEVGADDLIEAFPHWLLPENGVVKAMMHF